MQQSAQTAAATTAQLTKEQLAEVAKLAATDRAVRSHEQAHLAAAGPYSTSGASYTFAAGPDGQRYAVAGEVALDVSPDPSDPEKTIRKARVIEAAANAPADPSIQDRAVAAMAAQMQATAQQELAIQQRELVAAAYAQPNSSTPGALMSLLA